MSRVRIPLYTNGRYWVCKEQFGSGVKYPKSDGYGVYASGITHSHRVATIGWPGEEGLKKAKAEADLRAAKDRAASSDE